MPYQQVRRKNFTFGGGGCEICLSIKVIGVDFFICAEDSIFLLKKHYYCLSFTAPQAKCSNFGNKHANFGPIFDPTEKRKKGGTLTIIHGMECHWRGGAPIAPPRVDAHAIRQYLDASRVHICYNHRLFTKVPPGVKASGSPAVDMGSNHLRMYG